MQVQAKLFKPDFRASRSVYAFVDAEEERLEERREGRVHEEGGVERVGAERRGRIVGQTMESFYGKKQLLSAFETFPLGKISPCFPLRRERERERERETPNKCTVTRKSIRTSLLSTNIFKFCQHRDSMNLFSTLILFLG